MAGQRIIYLTSNDVNDKLYIGKLANNKIRSYFGSGKYLKAALRKYGSEHFFRETLEVCSDIKDWLIAEEKWIKLYRSLDFILYNISDGKGCGFLSEEHKKKLSLAKKGKKPNNYGKKLSEETCRRMGLNRRGEKHFRYGCRLSEEHRNKISEGLKGNKNRLGKKILCESTSTI